MPLQGELSDDEIHIDPSLSCLSSYPAHCNSLERVFVGPGEYGDHQMGEERRLAWRRPVVSILKLSNPSMFQESKNASCLQQEGRLECEYEEYNMLSCPLEHMKHCNHFFQNILGLCPKERNKRSLK